MSVGARSRWSNDQALVCLQDLGAEPALDAALGDLDEAAMNRYPPLDIDGVLTEPAVHEHFLPRSG